MALNNIKYLKSFLEMAACAQTGHDVISTMITHMDLRRKAAKTFTYKEIMNALFSSS